jgi:hypothetical protein
MTCRLVVTKKYCFPENQLGNKNQDGMQKARRTKLRLTANRGGAVKRKHSPSWPRRVCFLASNFNPASAFALTFTSICGVRISAPNSQTGSLPIAAHQKINRAAPASLKRDGMRATLSSYPRDTGAGRAIAKTWRRPLPIKRDGIYPVRRPAWRPP